MDKEILDSLLPSDGLLADFQTAPSAESLECLVQRWLPLMRATAIRRLGHRSDLVDDVIQMVFCDLALKAKHLKPDGSLSGWLHQHTLFTISKALRSESRRKVRESIAVAMTNTDNGKEAETWMELRPHLDQALADLSPLDRAAVLLRYFEDKDLRSVGQEMGISEEAARKRVSRAVDKLRKGLAKQGLGYTSLALTVLITGQVKAATAEIADTLIVKKTAQLAWHQRQTLITSTGWRGIYTRWVVRSGHTATGSAVIVAVAVLLLAFVAGSLWLRPSRQKSIPPSSLNARRLAPNPINQHERLNLQFDIFEAKTELVQATLDQLTTAAGDAKFFAELSSKATGVALTKEAIQLGAEPLPSSEIVHLYQVNKSIAVNVSMSIEEWVPLDYATD